MLGDKFVFDADTHWCEHPDMFTSRASADVLDRVPRVEEVDGQKMWVMDGNVVMGQFSAGGVINRKGEKVDADTALHTWGVDDITEAAYNPVERLKVMDSLGIDAALVFPSTLGLGGQGFGLGKDDSFAKYVISMYNDIQAEIQDQSKNRLLPLPLMPAWSVEACVAEVKRVAAMGARGINMTSDPDDLGGPDLVSTEWDPFWEACVDAQLPVHFHIGASVTGMTFYGKYPWASHPTPTKLAIGGTLLFIGNARVVTNLILSRVFDRHPDLQTVSVESGCGWIPFILETLDYEMAENSPEELAKFKKMPSEYFKTNMYATFWFERNWGQLDSLVNTIGADRILFETDFPHPTCLYPDPLGQIGDVLAGLPGDAGEKILGANSKKLYRL